MTTRILVAYLHRSTDVDLKPFLFEESTMYFLYKKYIVIMS